MRETVAPTDGDICKAAAAATTVGGTKSLLTGKCIAVKQVKISQCRQVDEGVEQR